MLKLTSPWTAKEVQIRIRVFSNFNMQEMFILKDMRSHKKVQCIEKKANGLPGKSHEIANK